ncbi:Endochitinase 1 [Zalerion maritima]|uniref:Endochitinase 1 n=1 Tax=Zalerion maritima TaxID=339359 RepID=A0AAD5WTZ7_9PEZI|nr:Endochitinase 1 [Zalerion maritima]
MPPYEKRSKFRLEKPTTMAMMTPAFQKKLCTRGVDDPYRQQNLENEQDLEYGNDTGGASPADAARDSEVDGAADDSHWGKKCKNVVYFTKWYECIICTHCSADTSTYTVRTFQLADLDASKITHVLYAFEVIASDGEV